MAYAADDNDGADDDDSTSTATTTVLITVRLEASSSPSFNDEDGEEEGDGDAADNDNDRDGGGSSSSWRSICDRWGMEVEREVVYVQDSDEDEDELAESGSGRRRLPMRDEDPPEERLVIRRVLRPPLAPIASSSSSPSSFPAYQAGLRSGDVIVGLYGGTEPPAPSLLRGVLRDSRALEITVQRTLEASGCGEEDVASGANDNNDDGRVISNLAAVAAATGDVGDGDGDSVSSSLNATQAKAKEESEATMTMTGGEEEKEEVEIGRTDAHRFLKGANAEEAEGGGQIEECETQQQQQQQHDEDAGCGGGHATDDDNSEDDDGIDISSSDGRTNEDDDDYEDMFGDGVGSSDDETHEVQNEKSVVAASASAGAARGEVGTTAAAAAAVAGPVSSSSMAEKAAAGPDPKNSSRAAAAAADSDMDISVSSSAGANDEVDALTTSTFRPISPPPCGILTNENANATPAAATLDNDQEVDQEAHVPASDDPSLPAIGGVKEVRTAMEEEPDPTPFADLAAMTTVEAHNEIHRRSADTSGASAPSPAVRSLPAVTGAGVQNGCFDDTKPPPTRTPPPPHIVLPDGYYKDCFLQSLQTVGEDRVGAAWDRIGTKWHGAFRHKDTGLHVAALNIFAVLEGLLELDRRVVDGRSGHVDDAKNRGSTIKDDDSSKADAVAAAIVNIAKRKKEEAKKEKAFFKQIEKSIRGKHGMDDVEKGGNKKKRRREVEPERATAKRTAAVAEGDKKLPSTEEGTKTKSDACATRGEREGAAHGAERKRQRATPKLSAATPSEAPSQPAQTAPIIVIDDEGEPAVRSDEKIAKPAARDQRSGRSNAAGVVASGGAGVPKLAPTAASRATVIVKSAPPSAMRMSSLSSGTIITSTSNVAGLSHSKSTKLKRLYPDSTVVCKRIMKWCPPTAVVDVDGIVRFRGPVAGSNVAAAPSATVQRSSSQGSGGRQTASTSNLPTSPSSMPLHFRDATEMVKLMSPYVLQEGLSDLEGTFKENSNRDGTWGKKPRLMRLRSCTPVDPPNKAKMSPRVYEFGFDLDAAQKSALPENLNHLNELFVVHCTDWKKSCSCIGMIGSNDVNRAFLRDQKCLNEDQNSFRLWLCVTSGESTGTGWLAESDLPSMHPDGNVEQQQMYVMNIGTVANTMREYNALKSLAFVKSHLRKAIFGNSGGGDADAAAGVGAGERKVAANRSDSPFLEYSSAVLHPETISKPTSLSADLWKHLCATLNPFQLLAVEKIMMGKGKENISLVQGPPGTGKTTTIVGLVSALLNGSVPLPGGKPLGTRIQVGKSLSHPTKNDGDCSPDGTVSRRILVCAPSNAAVDELAWKLKKGAVGPNGKVGSFNIVRFGSLPGEERRDGRRRKVSGMSAERDSFLRNINLDAKAGCSEGRRADDVNFSVERRNILSSCHVVCTTLSGAGSKTLVDGCCRDEFPSSEFEAVIIDEACQASEASSLIPFKYNPNVVVLVGDPQQLPVLMHSQASTEYGLERSLFQRLQEMKWPIDLLRFQYRMDPQIESFPSRRFYGGQLVTSDVVKNRPVAPWHGHPCFPPLLMWNIFDGVMKRSQFGGVSNQAEVNFIVRRLLHELIPLCRGQRISIGIIAFYNDQVAALNQALEHLPSIKKAKNVSLQISTVDGFQGAEMDVIFLSCVRSNQIVKGRKVASDIGFLKDYRRVNVALTRAKHSLCIVGNCQVLSMDPLWKEICDDLQGRNLIATHNVFSQLAGGTWKERPSSSPSNQSKNRARNNSRFKSKKRYKH